MAHAQAVAAHAQGTVAHAEQIVSSTSDRADIPRQAATASHKTAVNLPPSAQHYNTTKGCCSSSLQAQNRCVQDQAVVSELSLVTTYHCQRQQGRPSHRGNQLIPRSLGSRCRHNQVRAHRTLHQNPGKTRCCCKCRPCGSSAHTEPSAPHTSPRAVSQSAALRWCHGQGLSDVLAGSTTPRHIRCPHLVVVCQLYTYTPLNSTPLKCARLNIQLRYRNTCPVPLLCLSPHSRALRGAICALPLPLRPGHTHISLQKETPESHETGAHEFTCHLCQLLKHN